MPNVTVSVFNTSASATQVSVNSGPQVAIQGTGPAQNWVPQRGTGFGFDYSHPQPNSFGPGPNQVRAFFGGKPVHMMISVPGIQITSLQLYIYSDGSWALLNEGQPISKQ